MEPSRLQGATSESSRAQRERFLKRKVDVDEDGHVDVPRVGVPPQRQTTRPLHATVPSASPWLSEDSEPPVSASKQAANAGHPPAFMVASTAAASLPVAAVPDVDVGRFGRLGSQNDDRVTGERPTVSGANQGSSNDDDRLRGAVASPTLAEQLRDAASDFEANYEWMHNESAGSPPPPVAIVRAPPSSDRTADLLLRAATANDTNVVDRLVRSDILWLAEPRDALNSALLGATASGNFNAVHCLLNATRHWGAVNHSEVLAAAVLKGHAAIATILAKSGTPLRPCYDALLGDVHRLGFVEILELFGAHGMDVSVPTVQAAGLVSAAAAGDVAVVDQLLAAGASVHTRNNEPMVQACAGGHLAVFERLLAAGASVHTGHSSPLVRACMGGHLPVVERLLEAGVSLHTNNDEPLVQACIGGHLAVVERLLAAGANVDAQRQRPLAEACSADQAAIVARLLDAGADPTALERAGSPMMELAHRPGYGLIAERLLAAGAQAIGIRWALLQQADRWRLVAAIKHNVTGLPPNIQTLWVLVRPRIYERMVRLLERVRARLEHPPTAPLLTRRPNRAELLAHLMTAGRSFARAYWTDGMPIFFPELVDELGPLPDELVFVSKASPAALTMTPQPCESLGRVEQASADANATHPPPVPPPPPPPPPPSGLGRKW